eukprot:6564451-Prymnesium_polylepis.1
MRLMSTWRTPAGPATLTSTSCRCDAEPPRLGSRHHKSSRHHVAWGGLTSNALATRGHGPSTHGHGRATHDLTTDWLSRARQSLDSTAVTDEEPTRKPSVEISENSVSDLLVDLWEVIA